MKYFVCYLKKVLYDTEIHINAAVPEKEKEDQ